MSMDVASQAPRLGRPPKSAADPYKKLKDLQAKAHRSIEVQISRAAARGFVISDDRDDAFDPNPEEVPEGHVRVKCRRKGAGKISTGLVLHTERDKFPMFKEGDVFVLPQELFDKYGEGPDGVSGLDWVELA